MPCAWPTWHAASTLIASPRQVEQKRREESRTRRTSTRREVSRCVEVRFVRDRSRQVCSVGMGQAVKRGKAPAPA